MASDSPEEYSFYKKMGYSFNFMKRCFIKYNNPYLGTLTQSSSYSFHKVSNSVLFGYSSTLLDELQDRGHNVWRLKVPDINGKEYSENCESTISLFSEEDLRNLSHPFFSSWKNHKPIELLDSQKSLQPFYQIFNS